ncbi:MAG: hypothetical protein ACOY4Q_03525 [Bacillota bacterium]
MEDFRIAPETDEELQRLRKKDRFFIWTCIIIFSIILTAVVGLYLSYRQPAARSAGRVVKASAEEEHGSKRCGFGGGSSCCGSPRQVVSDDRLKRLADIALARFQSEAGHLPVTARVTDYSCHIQIDIYDSAGKIIRRYGYQGGTLYEIK